MLYSLQCAPTWQLLLSCTSVAHMSSIAVSADISVGLPRKCTVFIIRKKSFVGKMYLKNSLFDFENRITAHILPWEPSARLLCCYYFQSVLCDQCRLKILSKSLILCIWTGPCFGSPAIEVAVASISCLISVAYISWGCGATVLCILTLDYILNLIAGHGATVLYLVPSSQRIWLSKVWIEGKLYSL